MRIHLEKFGGLIPSTDPHELPDTAAQIAHNVDLSGQTIRPWAKANDFTTLHDSAGEMLPGFPESDLGIFLINTRRIVIKDNSGLGRNQSHFCADPSRFIKIFMYMFFEYQDPDTNEYTVDVISRQIAGTAGLPLEKKYTNEGFILSGSYSGRVEYILKEGVPYNIHGPLFQVEISDTSYHYGAPREKAFYPERVSVNSSQIPDIGCALRSRVSFSDEDDEYTYGHLQMTDVDCQQYSAPYRVPVGMGDVKRVFFEENDTFRDFAFSFSCNYIDNTTRRYDYYYQGIFKKNGILMDSPATLMGRYSIEPGTYLNTKFVYRNSSYFRIFRSTSGGQNIRLLGAENRYSGEVLEANRESLGYTLPPNGNVPHSSVSEAVKGALSHPAGFRVYYYENEIRPSSEFIDQERPWACPEEYAKAFDSTIQCIALSGSTILVFTETAVYTVYGQHPARLASNRISDKPILHRRTLWQLGTMIGWVNEEGVAVYTGGGESLLTGEYYRADEWKKTAPDSYDAQVNDRAICLFNDQTQNLRFDLRGDRKAAISTFSSTSGDALYRWKSKVFRLQQATAWYAARVVAEGYPILLSFYGDGEHRGDVLVLKDEETLLPRMTHCKEWEFEVQGREEIKSIVIGTSISEV